MRPSSRSSRILRCVLSSSSSEDGCTLRLFCACDGTGMGRTGTEGHSPGRESLRRWSSICIFTLQWVEQIRYKYFSYTATPGEAFGFPHSRFSISDNQRFLSSKEKFCTGSLDGPGHNAWRSNTKSMIDASKSLQGVCDIKFGNCS